jgi:hypothetical protein
MRRVRDDWPRVGREDTRTDSTHARIGAAVTTRSAGCRCGVAGDYCAHPREAPRTHPKSNRLCANAMTHNASRWSSCRPASAQTYRSVSAGAGGFSLLGRPHTVHQQLAAAQRPHVTVCARGGVRESEKTRCVLGRLFARRAARGRAQEHTQHNHLAQHVREGSRIAATTTLGSRGGTALAHKRRGCWR